jgi:hypothetical protein
MRMAGKYDEYTSARDEVGRTLPESLFSNLLVRTVWFDLLNLAMTIQAS